MPGLDFVNDELADLAARGWLRTLRPVEGAQDRVVEIAGRQVVNFSSNNYLGLATHPALAQAGAATLASLGSGAGASRLIVGSLRPHRDLESELAEFHGRPAALLFNSGYTANLGTLQALLGPDDAVYSDELNHASIIDGCRLARVRIHVYPHRNVDALARMLSDSGPPTRRRIIVTDAVFSMDGDRAPLRELAELAERFGAALMVDEAHATGVLGPRGRGLAAELGVVPDIHMGTLGKGLGSFGAYVAGTGGLIRLLANRARSFVFTTALPPAVAAASRAALALCQSSTGDELRTRLNHNIDRFARGLSELGLLAAGAGTTPVFPVLVGDELPTMACSERLLAGGFFAQGIRPPTVPRGTARLRFALMATHTDHDLDGALAALSALASQFALARRVERVALRDPPCDAGPGEAEGFASPVLRPNRR